MNTHIFTDREKEPLGDWMTGRQDRNSNSHLHVTLNRLRKNEKQLTDDIKFLSLALRRLHLQNLRSRPDDLETTLTLLPIQLTAKGIPSYTISLLEIRKALRVANDLSLSTSDRLEAAIVALEVAKIMVKPINPDNVSNLSDG